MAQEITTRATALSEKTNIQQQVIVDIEGIPEIFGANPVTKNVRIGNEITIGEFTIGGVVEDTNSKDFISLGSGGTTTTIGQQINIEDGTPNSITKYNVELIDKNGLMSEILSPGIRLSDPMSTPVDVYFNFVGGAHPEDSIRVFSGIIDRVVFGAGTVTISIASPDQYKKQSIYQKYNNELTSNINDSVTTIPVESTGNFIEQQDDISSYILIGDEYMKVNSKTSTSFSVTRAQFGTTAEAHDSGDEVESFYRIQGKPIDIALKTMLSNGGGAFKTGVTITRFEELTPADYIDNAVFFPDYLDIQDQLGLVEGDTITITGASNAANNVTDAVITGFGTLSGGSYIVLGSESLVKEKDATASASFTSKYNTYPSEASFGMLPKQVDVAQFEQIADENASFFVDYDIPVRDTIEGDQFLTTELLFPSGLFSVFRKGRTSVVFLQPPLVSDQVPIFDETNIVDPDQIQIERGLGNRFYNAIVYRFNEDFVEDKFLAGEITQSSESTNIIGVGNRPLTLDVPGMRDNTSTRTLIKNASDRFLERYKFGAERIRLRAFYRDAFYLDLGDAVILKGRALKLTDSTKGERSFSPRVMEIQDKSINLNTGLVELLLVDTIYQAEARYGRVAPSSLIDSGATTTELPLKKSFGTSDTDEEFEKWTKLIGENIRVRSPDFTYYESTTLNGFSGQAVNTMLVDALASAPSADYIVEPENYDETDAENNELTKAIYVYLNRQIDVASGTSSTQFDVAAGDVSEFTVGTIVRIHSEDFTNDSGNVKITAISGTTITVEDMGFTPSSTDKVDRIAYEDGGNPYLYF